MQMKTIDVLGTMYTINIVAEKDDPFLKDCDGYTDKSSHSIVVTDVPEDNELDDFASYQRKVLRHEIIHAFLFESGLDGCWQHKDGHDETYVDWIAAQFPKLLRAFEEAGAL